jgi:uncharacterized protein YjbI with pentapeptide repeats
MNAVPDSSAVPAPAESSSLKPGSEPQLPGFSWLQMVLLILLAAFGVAWLATGAPQDQLVPGLTFGAAASWFITLLTSRSQAKTQFADRHAQWARHQDLHSAFASLGQQVAGQTDRLDDATLNQLRERLTNGTSHDGIQLTGHRTLPGADFTGHSFRGATFDFGASWEDDELVLDGADFSGANFNGVRLGPRSAIKATFNDATFFSARITSGVLTGAKFRSTRWRGAVIGGSETRHVVVLDGADFTDANLNQARIERCGLDGVCFAFCEMNAANLDGEQLYSADFSYTYLLGANLSHSYWSCTDFTGANLGSYGGPEAVDLSGVTIGLNAIFRMAWLGGANLSTIDGLERADLTDAIATPVTRWPDGFDWRAAGVRKLTEGTADELRNEHSNRRHAARLAAGLPTTHTSPL